jgi:hypothetical protein
MIVTRELGVVYRQQINKLQFSHGLSLVCTVNDKGHGKKNIDTCKSFAPIFFPVSMSQIGSNRRQVFFFLCISNDLKAV